MRLHVAIPVFRAVIPECCYNKMVDVNFFCFSSMFSAFNKLPWLGKTKIVHVTKFVFDVEIGLNHNHKNAYAHMHGECKEVHTLSSINKKE